MTNKTINTIFGKLSINIDSDQKNIFMRFTQSEKFNRSVFRDLFDTNEEEPSNHSLKWNIHTTDANIASEILQDRLNTLKLAEKLEIVKII